MTTPEEILKAGLPVRDFLIYVTANRTLVEVVHETSEFALHVSSVMEVRPTNSDQKFAEGSIGRMSMKARREVESGFPLLHANSLIGLWGALEACVDDLCLLWLQCMDRHRLSEALANTRGRIGEYLGLNEESRWLWILTQLQKTDASSLRTGIGQFESFLKPLGISSQVDENIRKALHRLKALRNLYAHRAGRADEKFLREWPEHPASVGQLVVPTGQQLLAAHTAMVIYVESIHDRILRELGEIPSPKAPIPWMSETKDLLGMLVPSSVVPEGPAWSHHFSDSTDRAEPPEKDAP